MFSSNLCLNLFPRIGEHNNRPISSVNENLCKVVLKALEFRKATALYGSLQEYKNLVNSWAKLRWTNVDVDQYSSAFWRRSQPISIK